MSIVPMRWTRKRKAWSVVLLTAISLGITVWLLVEQQRLAFAKRTHCVGNLNHIMLAKGACQEDLNIIDGEPIRENALKQVMEWDLGKSLEQYKCPSGGIYVIGGAGITPKCGYADVCYTYRFDWAKLRLDRQAWTHSLGR